MSARGALAFAGTLIAALALGDIAIVRAQDFAAPGPAGPCASAAGWLERALPIVSSRAGLEFLVVSWSAAGDLTTRAVAMNAAVGPALLAAGISASGDAEIGWNAAGLALGWAGPVAGVGLRALGRRDRAPLDPSNRAAVGFEAGAGFWSAVGARARIWASAPMIDHAGEAPPLDRGLETGASWCTRDLSFWIGWSAPARDVLAGERLAGAGWEGGAVAVWAEAREHPLRGSFGLRVHRGAIEAALQTDEHPALGESVRLSLKLAVGTGP